MLSALPSSFLVNNLWGMNSLLCRLLVRGTKGTAGQLLPSGRLARELSQWPLGQNIRLVSRRCICRTTPTHTWNNRGASSHLFVLMFRTNHRRIPESDLTNTKTNCTQKSPAHPALPQPVTLPHLLRLGQTACESSWPHTTPQHFPKT